MALTTTLVSYYSMSNGTLTTDALWTYNLTNTNSVTNTASWKIGYGADFWVTNTNQVLETSSTFWFTTTNAFSLSLWVKMNTEIASGTQTFIGISQQGTPYSQFRIEYEYNGGSRRVRLGVNWGGGYVTVNNTITLWTSTFHHLVVTYSGWSAWTITGYVNGTSIGTATAAISGTASFTNVTQIGALTNNFYSSAIIDEVGVWGRDLTSVEVTQLYNSGTGLTYPFTTISNSAFFMFL